MEWSDFIGDFLSLTEGVPSPELFRRWTAIALVAGALERRVWVKAGDKIAFANLYTMLVGPPGTGKYVIEEARQLMYESQEPQTRSPAFSVASDSVTKASLMDELAKAKRVALPPAGAPVTYHSLQVLAEEFGVLFPDYDQGFIASVNSIYNNKPLHTESRRTGSVRELKIELPQLNVLGGATPTYLANTFPEEAWSTGFARRLIMVYSSEPPFQELFFEGPDTATMRRQVLRKLGLMSQLFGQCKWHPDAAELIAKWHREGGPPAPTHSKLQHYTRSRSLHVQKLAIASTVARTGRLVIERTDVDRAIRWLCEAEAVMPDIFRAMIGKSDVQVIEELHYFVTAIWNKNRQAPVHSRLMWNFLAQRVPSDKIERLIMVAERSNIIARVAGTQDMFVPRPKHEHGME